MRALKSLGPFGFFFLIMGFIRAPTSCLFSYKLYARIFTGDSLPFLGSFSGFAVCSFLVRNKKVMFFLRFYVRELGQDLRDIMEDRQSIAQDLHKMKTVIAGILDEHSQARTIIWPTFDARRILSTLQQLLDEVEANY